MAAVEAEGLLSCEEKEVLLGDQNPTFPYRRVAAAGATLVLAGVAAFAELGGPSGDHEKSGGGMEVQAPPAQLSSSESSSQRASQPHIVMFTVDDMGWNDVGWRSTDLPNATSFMRELVDKSVLLTQYYTQPSCTPSRATMMTGKWAHENGFQNYELHITEPVGVPMSNKLMPEYMADLGYKTHMVGKWNIGHCNSK